MLGTTDKKVKIKYMKSSREEKRKVKRCVFQSKKKVNEQFGRKMYEDMEEDVNRYRKLFWKEVSNAKRGKMKNCSRIEDVNGRFARGEDET